MTGLTNKQLEFFNESGYLIVEDVLKESDLEALRMDYAAVLDQQVPRLVQSGKISEAHDNLPFEERYPKILTQLDQMYDLYQHLDISLPLLQRMDKAATLNASPAVFHNLLRHPAILDIAQSVLGGELTSNPVQHTRIKPPKWALPGGEIDSNIAKTNWHQDEAVLTDDAKDIQMLTVWVAITDATLENGCMICVPGSHRKDVAMHCPGQLAGSSAEIYIPDELIGSGAVPLPVGKGGVVLLNQQTIHGSLDNTTADLRWSFDLRYNVTGQMSGRDVFPGFVARSLSDPASELTDAEVWRAAWFAARDELVGRESVLFNERWKRFSDDAMCA